MKGFFRGSATAIITPFGENGVNYEVFGELIEHQIAGGTDAIVFLGTTGEPSTMSFAEERMQSSSQAALANTPVSCVNASLMQSLHWESNLTNRQTKTASARRDSFLLQTAR